MKQESLVLKRMYWVKVLEGSVVHPKSFELWADDLEMIIQLAEACHVQHKVAALRAADVSSLLTAYKLQTCHKLNNEAF